MPFFNKKVEIIKFSYKNGDPDLDPFLCDKLTITVNIDDDYMKSL